MYWYVREAQDKLERRGEAECRWGGGGGGFDPQGGTGIRAGGRA